MTLQHLLNPPAWDREDYRKLEQDYWSYVRELHFHPTKGSQFWLERAKQFNVSPSKEAMTLQEFLEHRISALDEKVLRNHPWHYFVPKGISRQTMEAHTSSGSVGGKKDTYWSKDALDYVIRYADYVLDLCKMPRGTDWLVTGTIFFYTLVKGVVTKRGGLVYADLIQTRGIKKLLNEAASLPLERFAKVPAYQQRMQPIMEYYQDTLRREKIGGLVAAPYMLPEVSRALGFENVRMIYLSGMDIPFETLQYWRNRLPDNTFLTSYGHHQLGLCFAHPDFEVPTYYSPAPLSLIYVVEPDNPFRLVKYGGRGKIRLVRMDEVLLWVQTERDFGERAKPHASFKWDGVKDIKTVWL